MKPKHIALFILVAAIIGFGLWWLMRPTKTTPEKTVAAPTPAKIDGTKVVASTAQVELPKAPTVPANAGTIAASAESVDPQYDLKTAIQDMTRLMRNCDSPGFYKTYTRPDKFDPKTFQNLINNFSHDAEVDPKSRDLERKYFEAEAQAYDALQNQTPTFNATGDEATYMLTMPSGDDLLKGVDTFTEKPIPLHLIKINGKWYDNSLEGN